MIPINALVKISAFFLFIKLIQLVTVYLAPSQFDTSSSILLDRYINDKLKLNGNVQILIDELLSKFVVWDSVYFMKLSTDGLTFEHEWVFGPLWWRLIRSFNLNNFYYNLIAGLLISNVCHYFSCLLMYCMTLQVFKSDKNLVLDKCAYVCSMLVVIQPAGIFSTANYSESITQLLCYLGVYLRQLSLNNENGPFKVEKKMVYILSGTMFSLAFGFRSNSLLYGIIYLDDLFRFNFKQFKNSLISILAGLQMFAALVYSVYLPYAELCPERDEWCESSTKSLVLYAQSYYWNNGFLKYFTVGNIPLFLIASPSLLIFACALINFRNCKELSGIVKVSAVYIFVQFTGMHVQIINRVMSFIPIYIWFVGYLLSKKGDSNKSGSGDRFLFSEKFGKLVVRWWIVWIVVQSGLYGCFLPPA